jgi:hypothetical protein
LNHIVKYPVQLAELLSNGIDHGRVALAMSAQNETADVARLLFGDKLRHLPNRPPASLAIATVLASVAAF